MEYYIRLGPTSYLQPDRTKYYVVLYFQLSHVEAVSYSLSCCHLLVSSFWCTNQRENSLYDTPLKCVSLFDTRQLFLPYMTSCLNFFPPVTLKCIFLTNGVKERHEKTSLPLVYNMTKKLYTSQYYQQ
jgi:hypothetical protein